MTDAKRYLQQVRLLDAKIKAKIEEQARLKDMVIRITPTLKDDIVSGGRNQDKFADNMNHLIDLSNEINAEIDALITIKNDVRHTIDKVGDENDLQFKVLHSKYILLKTWEQMTEDTGYSKSRLTKIHGHALKKVDELLKEDTKEDKSGQNRA